MGPELLRHRTAPFAVCATAGIATMALPPYDGVGHVALAAALVLVCVLIAVQSPPASTWQAAPPLLFFVVVAVVLDGSGGSASGLAPLVILPVLWIALYRSKAELVLAAISTGLVFLIPLAVLGAPDYSWQNWRRALLWFLVASVIGPVVQELVRALERRQELQTRLAARLDGVLAAATEHSIIATEPDGTITTFNQGAERMLGYSAEDVVGRDTPVLIHDPAEVSARAAEMSIEPGFEVFVRAARAGRPESREWTYIARDGKRVPVRLTVTAMRDPRQRILGFIGVATDITAEKAALEELRAAEVRWRILLDNLPDTAVLTIDEGLRYGVALGEALDRQGMGDVSGKTLQETSSAANVAILEPVYRKALAGEEGTTELAATNTGSIHEVVAVPLPPGDTGHAALVVARDVTESRHREEQLAIAKEGFASLFEEAPFAVVVLDVDGVILDVNPAACRLVGWARDELLGPSANLPDAAHHVIAQLLAELAGSHNQRVAGESRLLHRDGHVVDVSYEAILQDSGAGRPRQVLINAVDISDRRRFEEKLEHMAEHDPLTGLANRRRFDRELERHIDLCERYGPRGALLMMDLDNFKEVNDTLGHGAGDQLIVSVAGLLEQRMRKSDLVARLGGDEFVILLSEADRRAAQSVAADIVALVRDSTRFVDGSRPDNVTASVGVVIIDRAGISASELVSTADLTMYDAKESGRDQFVCATSSTVAPRAL